MGSDTGTPHHQLRTRSGATRASRIHQGERTAATSRSAHPSHRLPVLREGPLKLKTKSKPALFRIGSAASDRASPVTSFVVTRPVHPFPIIAPILPGTPSACPRRQPRPGSRPERAAARCCVLSQACPRSKVSGLRCRGKLGRPQSHLPPNDVERVRPQPCHRLASVRARKRSPRPRDPVHQAGGISSAVLPKRSPWRDRQRPGRPKRPRTAARPGPLRRARRPDVSPFPNVRINKKFGGGRSVHLAGRHLDNC